MNDLLLDTDILVDLLRLNPLAWEWLQSLEHFPATSCFSAIELLTGSRDKQEYRHIKVFLEQFIVLYPTTSDLERSVYRYTSYSLSDGIGKFDILIACVAVGHGFTLATLNKKHFNNLPDLHIVQPYTKQQNR